MFLKGIFQQTPSIPYFLGRVCLFLNDVLVYLASSPI